MKYRKRIWVPWVLMVVPLIMAGCTSTDASHELPSEQEQREEIERAVRKWVEENADELADQIGPLLTGDLPFLRDVASDLIERGLLAWLEVKVLHHHALEGERRYSARTELSLPVKANVPLIGERQYSISVQYDFIIEDGKVADADIDTASFRWK